jgi:hypothetical protein
MAAAMTTLEPGSVLAKARLDQLRILSERACRWAYHERRKIDGPINWADLGPTIVEHYEDDEGSEGDRVWIEEAAPDAYELQAFVRAYLARRGFPGVEVRTEW